MTVSGTQPDSPVDGDGVETGAGSTSPGLTGSIPDASDHKSGTERLDDLRALLAVTIAHPKMPADIRRYAGGDECDVCVCALDAADAVLEAGFVRVSVDDDTEERVAERVREFHQAFGVAIGQHATGELRRLRADLLNEECQEARYALLAEDLHAIAKELADVVIVAYGAAVSFGIDLDTAVALVHASNMSKLGDDGKPVLRPDGKVLKGANYRPPDMRAAVQALRDGGEA